MIPVAIIGAGMAGLACARRLLRAGMQPVLFDKSRAVGGRVATRRIEVLQFDHGAQYVTARTESFSQTLAALQASGAAASWGESEGSARVVGTPGMSALPRALAVGLQVQLNAQVTGLAPAGNHWKLNIGERMVEAERVVMTLPAPQAQALLGVGHSLAAALDEVRLAPCLTLMAAVHAPAPFSILEDADHPLAWVAHDGSKPGRPGGVSTCWVAQAGPAFSAEHLERDPQSIAALMLPMLCDRLGVAADAGFFAVAHRWRYARVTASLGQDFLLSEDATLYLGGDWCLGPRVEAAWASGTAIAEDLLGAS